MRPEDITILIVDDEDKLRTYLKEKLAARKYQVEAVADGPAAVRLVQEDPRKFDFVLIDQVLSPEEDDEMPVPGWEAAWDGIRTAVEILQVNRDIGTIIYTGKVGEEQQKAMAAGVHRYLFKKGEESLKDIESYLQEMADLQELKGKLADLNARREVLGSLVTFLNVGLALIDKNFRVWYADDRYAELVGDSDIPPGLCYQRFHDYQHGVCADCPVAQASATGESQGGYFLNSFAEGLKYIYSEASPVLGKDKKPLRDKDGEIMAVVKSMVDLREGQIMAAMGLEEQQRLIIRSLYQRGYNIRQHYDCIKLLEPEIQDNRQIWSCTQHWENGAFVAEPAGSIAVDEPALKKLNQPQGLTNTKLPGLTTGRAAYFWLQEGVVPPALLLVAGQANRPAPMADSDLTIIEAYAEKMTQALAQAPQRAELAEKFTWDKELAEFRSRLSQVETPLVTLEAVLEEATKLTRVEMGHIRTWGENNCVKVTCKGAYGKLARKKIDVYHPHSATARVIHSQQPLVINDICTEENEYTKDLNTLFSIPIDHPLVKEIRSLLIVPLVFLGKCYGFIKLMSVEPGKFPEKTQRRLNPLWQLASYAIHDYCRAEEFDKLKKEEEGKVDLARRTVHHIRNPLTALRNYLTDIREFLAQQRRMTPAEALTTMGKAEAQLKRIEELASGFQRLYKPRAQRLKLVELNNFLILLRERLQEKYPEVAFSIEPGAPEVKVEVEPDDFQEVLEELVGNAEKAAPTGTPVTIHLTLSALPGAAQLLIQDNTPGIPSDLQDKIFQPWVTSTPETSSGLGLSIVQKIMADHNGEIRLGETGPQGTTFVLILPAYKE